MKVELSVNDNCEKPSAIINVCKMTDNIQTAIKLLENENEKSIIVGELNDHYFMIDINLVEVVATDGKDVLMHTKDLKKYKVSKTLYELEEMLGTNFVRISKSSIVSINQISHVGSSFNGTMDIWMKSGFMSVITRSYKKQFKERIGV